jgi:hypothetical protein
MKNDRSSICCAVGKEMSIHKILWQSWRLRDGIRYHNFGQNLFAFSRKRPRRLLFTQSRFPDPYDLGGNSLANSMFALRPLLFRAVRHGIFGKLH